MAPRQKLFVLVRKLQEQRPQCYPSVLGSRTDEGVVVAVGHFLTVAKYTDIFYVIFKPKRLCFFDIERTKNSSRFPQLVIIFVHLIRFISVVTKIQKSQCMKQSFCFIVFP
jgi:hypothetical protein